MLIAFVKPLLQQTLTSTRFDYDTCMGQGLIKKCRPSNGVGGGPISLPYDVLVGLVAFFMPE